ncbi:hypothetical protein GY21_19600 [Cryobacterium roopkundense]|uniref:Uncharacterized protein n=1 Tax=Cryobacterium roopkundense TaxID=1001240 RepID=A0A099J2N9_9MICO|nr:hypothetical protein [Cryobacterium roopkundense]KGJ71817.1 hypothetical protein GY21_19600 [Cryobacterium roopkundense]MBB5640659.1 hypothetical protein [Cryobacterium roopkundense]
MYPKLDQQASAQAGEPLELLTRIRSQQPFVPAGPGLSEAAVELLAEAVLSGRWSRFNLKKSGSEELIAAGLMAEKGIIAPAGKALGRVWRDPRGMVTAVATYGARTTLLRAWIGDDAAVIEAGPSLAAQEEASAPDDLRTLQMVGVGHVMDVFARWIGIAPAWAFEIEPTEVPLELFEARRLDASVAPPENANDFLGRLWAEPWTIWIVGFGLKDGPRLAMVSAGSLGYLRCAVDEERGVVTFEITPPAKLYWELYSLFGNSL